MAPAVSVVVPVFNGARFLGECLEALRGQDHGLHEVIVVDDGSEDDSVAVAQRFAGVRVLRRAHEGLPATRNAGVAAATGDLIGFSDSDDVWKPEKARLQVEYLDAHPDAAVVLCRHDTMLEPGTPWPPWLRRDQRFGDLDGVSPTGGLFRRTVFDDVGTFRADVGMISDFELIIRIRRAGLPIALIAQPLFGRRVHGDNMMHSAEPPLPRVFKVLREHLRSGARPTPT